MTFHTQPDVKIKESKKKDFMKNSLPYGLQLWKTKNEKTCEIVESKEWDI